VAEHGRRRCDQDDQPAVYDKNSQVLVHDGIHILAATNASNQVTHRYMHGPLVDQVLAEETVNPSTNATINVNWLLGDHLGTIREVSRHNNATNTTSVIDHVFYDSFGRELTHSATDPGHRFGYTGRDRDPETDLDYYRARYYNPSMGRFISQDPIGFSAGDVNVQRYVGNSPTNAIDPSGLEDLWWWWYNHEGGRRADAYFTSEFPGLSRDSLSSSRPFACAWRCSLYQEPASAS
jgi:RHS repeat-associated protein